MAAGENNTTACISEQITDIIVIDAEPAIIGQQCLLMLVRLMVVVASRLPAPLIVATGASLRKASAMAAAIPARYWWQHQRRRWYG